MQYSCLIIRHLYILLCFISVVAFSQNKPKKAPKGIEKVLTKPYQYEYPTIPLMKEPDRPTTKPWIVYSDRSNNNSYGEASLTTIFQKNNFLDSFYVTREDNEVVEIIKCKQNLLLPNSINISDPNLIEYCGWIEKSKLILSEKSFIDLATRRPFKNVTILTSLNIFDKVKNSADNHYIKVFDGPDSQIAISKELRFDEIIYIYKRNKDKILVGKRSKFNKSNAPKTILGWIQADFTRSWGQRLCIQPKDNKILFDKPSYIFPTKEQALSAEPNPTETLPLIEEKCSKAENRRWRAPLLKVENVLKGKEQYKLIITGAPIPIYDKTKSFIYNVNGSKITYTRLCEMVGDSKKVNIVFVINSRSDVKEYFNSLVNTFQELSGFFNAKKDEYSFKFGATDGVSSNNNIALVDQYSTILPSLINMVKSSVEHQNNANSGGMVAGLYNASKLLKGHEDESNIVVLISSQADPTAETNNKSLKESLISDLAKNHTRLVLFQPYCGSSAGYSNFVPQAKSFIKGSAEKVVTFRRDKQVNNNINAFTNSFKAIRTGNTNVYCLDYPSNSNYQGFIIFPTIGNNIEDKYMYESLDSLLSQVKMDNERSLDDLREVFNSPSSFNNTINPVFQKHYSTIEPLPTDVTYYLKNNDYNYFIDGYLAFPAQANTRSFQYTLLLNSEEYEELYQLFKNLQINLITPSFESKMLNATYNAITEAIRKFAKEREDELATSMTLASFFQIATGYLTTNSLMHKYKVNDLKASGSIPKEDLKALIEYLNYRISSFYSLRNQSKYYFYSNGEKYYWVSENYQP